MAWASAINEMAASRASNRIAAAFLERTVQVWDIESASRLAEFDTVFSFGGPRIAIDASGERCVAAGWTRGIFEGVACYQSSSGSVLWHRTDLNETSTVKFSLSGSNVWCVTDGATMLLDAATGDVLEKLSNLNDIYDSSYSDVRLLDVPKRSYIVEGKQNFTIPRLTFALLAAVIGPTSICISESGGVTRCVEVSSGTERWRYDPGKWNHILRLWYRPADDAFYGVQWEYNKGSQRTLIRFAQQTGRPQEVCDLSSSWTETVSPTLDCVVTSSGSILALSDGRLLNCLPFPQRDYA
jgi:outer membrane protein assembly factor BamB